MNGLWNKLGIPHKGWNLVDVVDIRDEGQSEADTDYEECMMCGRDKIRYVHIVEHNEVHEQYRVGCNCAEKMTSDYINPKQKEQALIKRTKRRETWVKKEWRCNANNNYFLKTKGHFILIYRNKLTGDYKVKIDDTFGNKSFKSLEIAKIAAFNGVEYMKELGTW